MKNALILHKGTSSFEPPSVLVLCVVHQRRMMFHCKQFFIAYPGNKTTQTNTAKGTSLTLLRREMSVKGHSGSSKTVPLIRGQI